MRLFDKRKQILVTGGAGAIGSCLVRRLLEEEQDVLVIDDLSSGHESNLLAHPQLSFISGSIVDDEVLRDAFETPPQIIFHMAALFANQNSVDHAQRDLEVNGKGTLKMLEHALKAKVERFVYASSSCVFGNPGVPVHEQCINSMDTPYAITKLLGEQYVGFFQSYHKLPCAMLRYFNSYGPGEYPGKYRNVIPNFFARAMKGLPLIITGTGAETRDFTFVDDIVTGTLLAAIHPAALNEHFNLGSGRETPILTLAESINRITGNSSGIEFVERRKWDHVLNRCADIGKASKMLGYEPTILLEEGLQKTYQWMKESYSHDQSIA